MVKSICNLTITADHPLVREHLVHGQALLPGLAYIDLLYQLAPAITGFDYKSCALRRLSLSNPLAVSKNSPIELKITFEKMADIWAITVEGAEAGVSGAGQEEKLYITAELHPATNVFREQINIEGIRQQAVQRIDVERQYEEARKRGLVHRGMLKANGTIYLGVSECLIEVRVAAAYSGMSRNFLFHPTLIDGAALASGILKGHETLGPSDALYLPLYYDSFFCTEPLQNHCLATVNLASVRMVNEIRTLDIVFYNLDGKKIGELRGVTGKRLRFKEQINPDRDRDADVLKIPFGPPKPPQPQTATNGVVSNVASVLQKIFAKYLNRGSAALDLDRGFFELGLESSQLLVLVRDIESAFALSLSPTLLFEYSNLRELAGVLETKLEQRGVSSYRTKAAAACQSSPTALIPEPNIFRFDEREAFLQDHLVYQQPALMGVTYPCLVLEAYLKNSPEAYPVKLADIQFIGGPVTLQKQETVQVQIEFDEDQGRKNFKTYYYLTDPGQRRPCCTGHFSQARNEPADQIDIETMIGQSTPVNQARVAEWYHSIKDFTIGPLLQTIDSAYVYNDSTSICKVCLAGGVTKGDVLSYVLDPLLLNTCYLLSLRKHHSKSDNIFVPLLIESLTVFGPMTEKAYIVKTIRCQKDDFVAFDALVFTETGNMIAKIINASLKEVADPSLLKYISLPIAPSDELKKNKTEEDNALEIAIVGLAGRYPQSYTVREFWNNLRDGSDCISEIPQDRWDWREYYADDRMKPGHIYSKWGGFIADVDRFDPLFFNISPHEAEMMDPQERLFLEHCWIALEDAGYTREKLKNSADSEVGVYVGVMHQEYPLYAAELSVRGQRFGLGGGISSIAARVSYFCNFHGPSMAIDTMCSSSLTAIYLACRALKEKRINAALAGGVNLSLHPNKYLLLSQGQFISSQGHCASFGESGDGYIPGEGVGVLFLKRLDDAKRDHDHIYGVIKGAAINHGGKASGYTVPNPQSQSLVIDRALREGGIEPSSISYIEAHGTGTQLGDPIEIAGLVKAFGNKNQARRHCWIGSVKSNIGHCEAAAGVAGMIKVLLQMRYGKIVPSLHSKTLNQNIDFAATAFQVNQELRDWQRPVMDGREQPRRAGVSSFGASGSNAHIVIEEYIPPQLDTAQIGLPPNPAIIVLTAKNQERLNARARQLLDLIDEQQLSDAALMDMAYTLQVGREAMEERMALVVRTMAELREKLQRFAEGRENIDGCYRGQVKQSKEPLDIGAAADKPEETVAGWLAGEDYPRLLSFWVKGLSFDWNKIYGAQHPRRISLPTYPFARERYWITDRFKTGSLSKSDAATYLHPLLHQNTSNFEEQRFSSIFTGKEFFLTDHVIQSQSVLPGVAYLEMARAAVVRAVGAQTADSFGIRLKNVAWIRPITVEDEKVPVHIRLFPEAGGDIAYEIYSKAESENEAAVIYGQGLAVLGPMTEGVTLDLSVLQAECSLARFNPVQCYEIFKTMGIEYGPAHQGIERVYVGPGQVLAKLSLPGNVSGTADEFVLHPSMMDAALQASIALIMQSSDSPMPAKPALPFALRELEILGRCAASMWAFIRRSDPAAEGRKVQKVDIDLCDDQGRICVRMKELSSRVLEGEIASLRSGTLMFHPEWQEQAVAENTAPPVYAEHIVLLCEPDRVTMEYLQARMEGARVGRLKSERREIAERYQNYVIDAFEEIQAILKAKPLGPVLIQVVLFTQQAQQRLFAGIAGLLRTVRLENPKLIGQLIEVEEAENPEGIINKLTENRRHAMAAHVRYHGGKRWVRRWREIRVSQTAERIPWKDQGVYLITGGAGGLGLIFAKEMASKIKGAVLALVGRTALSPAKQALLNEIGLSGNRVEYRRADVTLKEQVDNLIASMVEEFGGVDGIIHSAGLIRDNLIIKKNRAEVSEVLAPKVAGLVNLDQATRDLPLDFFILFSSGSGAEGNVGQADYAAANAFMDAYAWYRGSLVASKQRRGQTLSVNWPLWREGGMRIDAATEKILRQNTGIVAMPTSHGIKALYQALASGKEQVLVLEGDRRQLRAGFLGPPSRFNEVNALPDLDQSRAKPAVTGEALRAKAIHYFKQLLSVVLKLPSQRIEAETAMERYGIDSVMVMQLTNQLEQVFGSLSKTLFYEYPNLKELTDYFLVNYRERLIGILGVEDKVAIAGDWVSGTDTAKSPLNRGSNDRISANWKLKAKRKDEDEIAIIGVSGRYPMADTMDEFWENLKNGRDCITEIPSDRWDWRQFYDLNQNCVGKSYSKWGGFIRDVDKFDPLIFNIAPREAKLMDPQERLFLQTVWHTLEDAGYSKSRVSGKKAGVFVGVMYGQYQLFDAVETSGKNLVPSSSYASIANRVSYYFDFSGPSIALDTMCSSSLTAIHLACQSIREGESDLAIAGGVNVTIHPHKYLLLSQGKFAASDGRCRSFGAGGDGYVPGEGVGAVLLKPLGQAEADGDHIYAVIKSSVLNHGGKTNGYTVPNPNAQAELISAALRKANCDPEKISYIEAHGTGTSLGDPIEITGLMKAYGAYHQEKQYCSIGSVKSNVGHLESAAGIVGVTKILLQMKYKQLVPSLHAEELNPHINFEASPFHVQQKLEDWRQTVMLENGLEKKYPRRAGISSFGAGGANAHIILEEWERDGSGGEQEERLPQIIVLSAKNKERLQEYCKLLARFLEKDQAQTEEMALADIAYTLQVGREPLEERLAIVVDSKRDLVEQLTLFVQEESVADSVRSGSVRAEPEKQGLFDDADEAADLVKLWWRKGKFLKIAELWVHGVNVNWMLLDRLRQPRRVSLPGYPFARERYWLAPPFLKGKRAGSHAKLHPLLDTINLPMSYESGSIVFEKNLGQTDLIVKDHQVTGKFMFPGVGYLEMVCGALAQIHPRVVGRLAKVVWLRPLTVEADMKETRIIIKKENGVMRYEIQSGDTAHKVAHSKGEIYPETSNTGKSRDYLPLESIKARCNVIEPDIFYESFAANGILYGAYFKGVTGVWASLDEALGFICLPKEFKEEFEHYTLHPTLMDGSLQTIAAVGYGGARKDTGRSLPFAVEEVEILHPLQEKMYTYVKALGGRRYNLCMADESGLVCVKLDGVALREVKDSALNFFYLPVWRPEAVLPEPAPAETAGKSVLIIYSHPGEDLGQALAQAHVHDRVTTVCLGDETGREKENEWQIKPDHSGFDPCIEKLGSIDIIYYLGAIEDVTMDFSEPDACDASQEIGIFSLFRLVKSLYSHQLGGKRLSLKVVTNNSIPISTDAAINPCAATLHGFTSSLAKENPAWGVSCLDISFGVVGCNPTDRDWAEWVNALVTEPADKKGAVVAYRRGTRYRRSIQPLRLQGAAQNPFKQHGVYLIVGGAGGIGGALSLYLAETVQARLVIVGRSDPDQEMSKKFAAIQSRGGEVLYVPADVANSENMKSAVAKGKSRFGGLDGVIHSALVLQDKTLVNMEEEALRAVLTPKVKGSIVLYNAVKEEKPDFIMFFSSAQSFGGNLGQSNYAAACTFQDAFAQYISQMGECPVKIINWGYWGDVGAVATEEYQKRMAAKGIYSIDSVRGMEAIKRALGNSIQQVIALKASEPVLESLGIDRSHTIELSPQQIPSLFRKILNRNAAPVIDAAASERFHASFDGLTGLGRQLLLKAFNEMGVLLHEGERYEKQALQTRLGIISKYTGLLDALLQILAAAEWIQISGTNILTTNRITDAALRNENAQQLETLKRKLISSYPEVAEHVRLIWTCLQRYPEILQGEVPATDIIFPDSSMELVEKIYRGNKFTDYYNQLVVWSLLGFLKERLADLAANQKISILEVGAGTGGTSAAVFDALRPYGKNVAYVYTDISLGFIQYGRRQYGAANPFVEFRVLDIENQPEKQGYVPGEFDVVVATNVLHATRNITNTLTNCKKLLKTHGLLIINEATDVHDFTTLTFGLLDGWWLFDDAELRIKGAPLLSPPMWEQALKRNGFVRVALLGQNGSGQKVIIAESNGLIAAAEIIETLQEAGRNASLKADAQQVAIAKRPENGNSVGKPGDPAAKAPGRTREYLELKITESLADVLQVEKEAFDLNSPYTDFGMDSVLAVEIVNRINEQLNLNLKTTDMFNYSTIKKLSEMIMDQYGHQFVPPHATETIDSVPLVTPVFDAGCPTEAPAINEYPARGAFSQTIPGFSADRFTDSNGPNGTAVVMLDPENKAVAAQDIAIIGVSGQFPGARDLNSYWDNLSNGKNSIKVVQRWAQEALTIPGNKSGANEKVKWMGHLENYDQFDPMFFNISPREAEMMDPQQRLFLMEAWKAIEDAGYSERDMDDRKCGVFVGCGPGDYALNMSGKRVAHEAYSFMGNDDSILAARISYFLNLKGPSMAINTACSSSLVAIHLACDSIRSGSSDLAIAGGVAVLTTPRFHLLAGQSGMLSPDGQCKTFDDSANGFVPGEGVGAIVLKSLQDAIRDQDHIYAVIKGSGINQDGRTNGITAPSALAQSELEQTVYEQYRIDPQTISYIEAHGTGTKLGDPIELEALTAAFRKYTDQNRFCAIGSVKTNIGHALAAAGIAGLLKIVLCLKHQKLVPSLNLQKVNQHLQLKDSPFYISESLAHWGTKAGLPRRAAISSFGFSGTNVHLVIEEAREVEERTGGQKVERPYYLFALSAKSAAALQEKLKQLEIWLAKDGYAHAVKDVSFTLNAGRSHFPVRAAIVADGLAELLQKIRVFREKGQVEGGIFNNIKSKTPKLKSSFANRTLQLIAELHDWHLEAGEYRKKLLLLADFYVKGGELDWTRLYEGDGCRRISMPAYPFITSRYWIPEEKNRKVQDPSEGLRLHPLIEQNTSTLAEQKFTTRLTGEEFYFRDHVLGGAKVLPAAVYVEMSRAAGDLAGRSRVTCIKNLVWPRPFKIIDSPRELHIGLYPYGDEVKFEIYGVAEASQMRVIHCRGDLIFNSDSDAVSPRFIAVEEIKARCGKLMDGAEFYDLVKQRGLCFGSTFKVLQSLWGNGNETFSTLAMPEDGDAFSLHPSLLDAALQTALAGLRTADSLYVPFSIGAVHLSGPLTDLKYIYSVGTAAKKDEPLKESLFDIYLLNQHGTVLVKINQFSARRYYPKTAVRDGLSTQTILCFREQWAKSENESGGMVGVIPKHVMVLDSGVTVWNALKKRLSAAGLTDIQIILVKPGEGFQNLGQLVYAINPDIPEHYSRVLQSLREQEIHPDGIIHLWSQDSWRYCEKSLEDQQSLGVFSLFHLARALMERQWSGRTTLLYVFPEKQLTANPLSEAVSGFAKSLSMESPALTCKTVGLPMQLMPNNAEAFVSGLLDQLLPEFSEESRSDLEVFYEDKQRFVREFKEFDLFAAESGPTPLKRGGVYLITGGVGGLGYILAEYLAREFQAKLVLTGRSVLTPEKEEKIKRLRARGAEVVYLCSDISNRSEVASLIINIRQRFTALHGIIHCAGIISDKFIAHKTKEELATVMAPKIKGTVWLDEATQDETLDFFVLFSSIAAVFGNAGQSDYAYANRFMDCFAGMRERMRIAGSRSGKTLAINWPFWKDGGMAIDASTEAVLERKLGLQSLSAFQGIKIFAESLKRKDIGGSLVVLEGNPEKLRRKMSGNATAAPPDRETIGTTSELDETGLMRQVNQDLLMMVVKVLKINADDISVYEEMSEFGFDSISLTELSTMINEKFDTEVLPATFFEHSTLQSFGDYLRNKHKDKLINYYQRSFPNESEKAASDASETMWQMVSEKNRKSSGSDPDEAQRGRFEKKTSHDEPIAIIGMSGVMPQSDDLEELWSHLEQGDDLITEIPEDRWNWRRIYGDPVSEANKTNVKWGGFMKEVDKFDNLFFGISPKEAELMDPQQRIVMEVVWRTIEDAGYQPSDLWGSKTGIFIGVASSDYGDLLSRKNDIQAQTSTGMAHSIMVNRISYLLNLRGGSEPIDTACSSALVAIDRAVREIQAGNCDMAMAGGVNVILSPTLYISFSKAGMLSTDGRCKTFDKRANGYVRGEGCGIILLKPLGKAKADGDHIYAVIKGCSVSHGGRSNSLTAPNPNAQAELLVTAWEKAGLDPSTLTYIEAHGTGTALGDPIEINGIKKAFHHLYAKWGKGLPAKPQCGIGSIKTNMGHLEAASGIAGVIKVLLAMKHGKIPASINIKELNPYIKLEDSPLYIVNETKPWEPLRDRYHQKIPRRAGVSSFGYGGVNAHIVLEEYEAESTRVVTDGRRPRLIVLSAKNAERLRVYAGRLAEALKQNGVQSQTGGENYSLEKIAYTLQVGREALEERLAVVVSDIDQLVARMEEYCRRGDGVRGLYRGTVNIRKSQEQTETAHDESPELTGYFREGNLDGLAKMWTAGQKVDWRLLWGESPPRRVSLPTYPFVRERFWIPASSHRLEVKTAEKLHPLIGQNVSTLKEEKFSNYLTGSEFYLTSHKVFEHKVLPGAAYLEMARAAGEIALEREVRFIRNVVWAEPIVFAGDLGEESYREMGIGLHPDGQNLGFVVSTGAANDEPVIHSEGEIICAEKVKSQEKPEFIDIEAIKGRCPHVKDKVECYGLFAMLGFNYGAAFRLIDRLYCNRKECLSSIEMDFPPDSCFSDYILHPSLLDAAMQTIIGLVSPGDIESKVAYMPFALGEIAIRGPIPQHCYAYVTVRQNRNGPDSALKKFDIRIADPSGRVIVSLKDFSARAATLKYFTKMGLDKTPNNLLKLLKQVEDGLLDVDEANRLLEVMNR